MTHQDDGDWLSDDQQTAWRAVADVLMQLPSALDRQLQRDAGMSFFEYMVLAALAEQPDRSMQMSDVARFASSSLSRLSHTARRLEAEGYLRREQLPGAGRRTRAILTDAGEQKMRAAAPGHVAEVRRLLIDAAGPHDLHVVARVAERVLNRIYEA